MSGDEIKWDNPFMKASEMYQNSQAEKLKSLFYNDQYGNLKKMKPDWLENKFSAGHPFSSAPILGYVHGSNVATSVYHPPCFPIEIIDYAENAAQLKLVVPSSIFSETPHPSSDVVLRLPAKRNGKFVELPAVVVGINREYGGFSGGQAVGEVTIDIVVSTASARTDCLWLHQLMIDRKWAAAVGGKRDKQEFKDHHGMIAGVSYGPTTHTYGLAPFIHAALCGVSYSLEMFRSPFNLDTKLPRDEAMLNLSHLLQRFGADQVMPKLTQLWMETEAEMKRKLEEELAEKKRLKEEAEREAAIKREEARQAALANSFKRKRIIIVRPKDQL